MSEIRELLLTRGNPWGLAQGRQQPVRGGLGCWAEGLGPLPRHHHLTYENTAAVPRHLRLGAGGGCPVLQT